ncbi:sulfur carrier protein ThiS [Bilophila sp.]|uniref:sulfur carrier protein ThiS n=1 Tax=Bilophila sp. TaxID=1929485 RepID=UPI003076C609
MDITVNGKLTACSEGATLLDLILQLGLSPEKIVVERNRDIVPAGTFAETALQDGDSLELLQFVGGG